MIEIFKNNILTIFTVVFFPIVYISLIRSLFTGKLLVRGQKIPLDRNENSKAFWRVWIFYMAVVTFVFIIFIVGEFIL
jgi:hypothetical protein